MENSHLNYTTEFSGKQAISFKIDPEFQNKIPPIGKDEFEQLEGNIILAGEVFDPLVVWKEENILVDGHNRWKIIQANDGIEYKVRYISFKDKWAAFDWMYKNQLGRRNLTDEQRSYTIGKMYEARKKSSGGQAGNDNAMKRDAQNGQLVATTDKETHGVSGEIALELNIGRNTVRRAEHFAKGVDALRKVNPEAADKVLSGKAEITKTEVQSIAKATPDEVHAIADKIMNPPKKEQKQDTQGRKNIGRPKEYRELREIVESAIAAQTNIEGCSEYFIDDLIEDIEVNGKNYVNSLRNMLTIRKELLVDADAKNRVFKAIAGIMQEITKTRGEFTV